MRQATPLPDMEAKLSLVEQGKLKREFMIHVLNRKADWMERTLKPILPRDIYRMVWDTSGGEAEIDKRHEIVRKYLKSQDIRIEEHGLNARVLKGREQVGQAFYVSLSEK